MATAFKHPDSNPLLGVKVKPDHFTGGSNTAGDEVNSLSNIIRGIAADNARAKIELAGVADVTNSAGGTILAPPATVAMTIPTATFDSTTINGAQLTNFDAVAIVNHDSLVEFGDYMNNILVRLGLPRITWTTATIATENTISALTASVTGATTGQVGFASGVATMNVLRSNYSTIHYSVNNILSAVGENTITDNSGGAPNTSGVLVDPPVGVAGSDTDSIRASVMNTFMDAMQENVTNIAAALNYKLFQAGLADLTGNPGGTGSLTLAALTNPPAYAAGAGYDCAPYDEFNTELAIWRNNTSDLTARVNLLNDHYGLTKLTDSSGGTANTALETMAVTLTDVDPTGANGANHAEMNLNFTALKNNVSTLATAINTLCPYFGEQGLVNSTGGTTSTTYTLVAMPDQTIGKTGADAVANATIEGTVAEAALVVIRNWYDSMQDKVNAMTGSTELGDTIAAKPLKVVAGV